MSGETIYPYAHLSDMDMATREQAYRERRMPRREKSNKDYPVARGVLDYFPDAILAIAEVSRIGNEQHNPGEPMHWDRDKSTDQVDALVRHLIHRGKLDTDGLRHTAKAAWRALALLQIELEYVGLAAAALAEREEPVRYFTPF